MTKQEIEQRVHDVIANVLAVGRERIKNDSVLTTQLGADSLEIVELVMSIGQEFGLDFGDANEELNTVSDVVAYVSTMLAARSCTATVETAQ